MIARKFKGFLNYALKIRENVIEAIDVKFLVSGTAPRGAQKYSINFRVGILRIFN